MRAEGASSVVARGTTLLAQPEGLCISQRLLACAPLTRTYLGNCPFFGRPLGGAFDSGPSVPGSHHPRVAWMNELSTTPRQHGHRQDESRRKDNSRNLRVVYEMLATPSGFFIAPAAAAESGEDPPRGAWYSSRCPPEAAFDAVSASERENKKGPGHTVCPDHYLLYIQTTRSRNPFRQIRFAFSVRARGQVVSRRTSSTGNDISYGPFGAAQSPDRRSAARRPISSSGSRTVERRGII
jgi:hypothetical protein